MKASFVLITVGVLAGTGVAFADGDPAGGGGGDASGGGSAAAPATAAPTAPAAGGVDLALDTRPLITPKDKLAVDLLVPFLNTADGAGNSNLAVSAVVGVTYGLQDKLEVGGSYSIGINPSFDAQGVLTGRAAYFASHTDKMDIALAAALSIDTDGANEVDLALGAWVRYRLAPKLTLFTGQPVGAPQGAGGIFGFLVGPETYQFTVGLNNGNPAFLSIPVGVGYQATPNVWVYGQLTLADLEFSPNSAQEFIFSDFIPITVGGWYSMDKIDIGASFGDDLKNAGDLYAFTINARYWAK